MIIRWRNVYAHGKGILHRSRQAAQANVSYHSPRRGVEMVALDHKQCIVGRAVPVIIMFYPEQ